VDTASVLVSRSWFKLGSGPPPPVFPFPPPIDLATAVLNTANALTTDMVHCFPMAVASVAGSKDYVTGLDATASGTIVIASTAAGDAYESINALGFTPASSVADLTDQLTMTVIADTAILVGGTVGLFGHVWSQHPAWFYTNKDYSFMPSRFAMTAGGVEYSVDFNDAHEAGADPKIHVYVAVYDGATLMLYQGGVVVGSVSATGDISDQDAAHTRIGCYWGVTDGTLLGDRKQIMQTLSRRAWSAGEVASYSANPWQIFKAGP